MQEGIAPEFAPEQEPQMSFRIEDSYSVNPMFSGHFLAPALGWDEPHSGHVYDSAGESDHSSSYDAVDKDGAPIRRFGHKHLEEEEVITLDEDGQDIVELDDEQGDAGGGKCLNRGYSQHSSSALTSFEITPLQSFDQKVNAQHNDDIIADSGDEDAILGI